jgi:hypothetical protein
VQKAIANAVRVILRADDSSGILGDAIRRLLSLHADSCRQAPPAAGKLVAWMIKFQFDGTQDLFHLDPVDYAPALGDKGLARYRAELVKIDDQVGPELTPEQEGAAFSARLTNPEAWTRSSEDRHARFLLDYNARRLAVVDSDVEAIIATHAGDCTRSYRLQETAEALAEIGKVDLAIDWAHRGAFLEKGQQAEKAALYWCDLLAQHRQEQELAARVEVMRRWPSSSNATRLYRVDPDCWSEHEHLVFDLLDDRPYDAVVFVQHTLSDVDRAWRLAHELGLDSDEAWARLVEDYQHRDPIAVLPVLTRLVDSDLSEADARRYKSAAKRLRQMRALAAGTPKDGEVDDLIAALRVEHRNRPRLQRELDAQLLP